jgi:DNA-directed RNA polymerase subunit H (RpoH/RPB5)
MSSLTNNRVISIYNSRVTILKLLERQGFVVDEDMKFSINEVDAMLKTAQLDMLLETASGDRKVFVKYNCDLSKIGKTMSPAYIDGLVDDVFVISKQLSKGDTLVVISEKEPSQSLLSKLCYLYDHDGVFVVVHYIGRLQVNILNHRDVPPMDVLSEQEAAEFRRDYNIGNNGQLPEISRFDAQALAMGVRPGQICRFARKSVTAMNSMYYRICV